MPQQTWQYQALVTNQFCSQCKRDVIGQNKRKKYFSKGLVFKEEISSGTHCHVIAPKAAIMSLICLFLPPSPTNANQLKKLNSHAVALRSS